MHFTAISGAIANLVYGIYAWLILLTVVAPVSAGLALTPGVIRRRRIARWGAATVFRLLGCRVELGGADIDGHGACMLVANHASYLDGIVLTAALPARFTFLIKHEMNAVPVASFVLRRLGSQFVKRAAAHERHRSARRLFEAALQGKALALFPEGTFTEEPGLRDFQMGAFRAAWRAGMSVIPAVVLGTRRKLPSGRWLPRPGPLAVHVCPPLRASDFADAGSLMRASREAILQHLAEPDLSGSAHSLPPERGSVVT